MSFKWEEYRGQLPWLQERTIFMTKHGSHAYGTNIATSDEDFKGIFIAPREYYIGNLHKIEQADKGFGDSDCTIYDIKKFFALAADCNPNIIEVLYTGEDDWLYPTPDMREWIGAGLWKHPSVRAFEQIYNNRHLFLSKKAKFTFSGYAFSQLKRIKTHRHWLLNPPSKLPERKDFKLPDAPTLDRDQLNAICAEVDKLADKLGGEGFTRDRVEEKDGELITQVTKKHGIDANVIEVIQNERRFRNSMANWHQYSKWKDERNATRSELERKHGFDTKHGMHLVRLMRMATEILNQGTVIVKRPDAEDLLSIRNGAWSFDKLMSWAEGVEKELTASYAASKLPREPDRQKIDDLLVDVIESYPR